MAIHSGCWAVNYFVSPTGDNRNAGTSVSLPKQTIQAAADLTAPGDTVFVMNGTYVNECATCEVVRLTRSGTPAAPIVFINYPGHRPKLHFTGWQGFHVLNGASYISIIGFEIEGHATALTLEEALNQPGGCNDNAQQSPDPRFNGNGISADGRTEDHPHHLVFAKNTIHHCGGAAIATNQADYVTIEDNLVYNNCWYSLYATSGISLYQLWNFDNRTDYHNVIRRNQCFNNRQEVPWAAGGCRITDGNGIIIDDNRNQQNNSALGPYTGRTLIENNIVWHNGGAGILTFLSDHVDIVHNTTYWNNQSDELNVGQILANSSNDVRIFNNILVSLDDKKVNTSSQNQTIEYFNNLHYGGSGADLFNSTCLVADPRFVNAGSMLAADFRLSAGSPAINAGSLQLTSTEDYALTTRPLADSPDIGAYEYAGLVTGIPPTLESAVVIFPNPVGATRTFTIQANQMIQKVRVYRIDGKQLVQQAVESRNASITLPDGCAPGLIIVEIQHQNGRIGRHKILVE